MVVLKAVINEQFEESFRELLRCWIVKIVSFLANIVKTFFEFNVVINWSRYTNISVNKTVCLWLNSIKVIGQVAWQQKTGFKCILLYLKRFFPVKNWLDSLNDVIKYIFNLYSLSMERPTSIKFECCFKCLSKFVHSKWN